MNMHNNYKYISISSFVSKVFTNVCSVSAWSWLRGRNRGRGSSQIGAPKGPLHNKRFNKEKYTLIEIL